MYFGNVTSSRLLILAVGLIDSMWLFTLSTQWNDLSYFFGRRKPTDTAPFSFYQVILREWLKTKLLLPCSPFHLHHLCIKSWRCAFLSCVMLMHNQNGAYAATCGLSHLGVDGGREVRVVQLSSASGAVSCNGPLLLYTLFIYIWLQEVFTSGGNQMSSMYRDRKHHHRHEDRIKAHFQFCVEGWSL